MNIGDRVIAVHNGVYSYLSNSGDYRYHIGDKGTVKSVNSNGISVEWDYGYLDTDCSRSNIEELKGEQTMNNLPFQAKPGDTVKVKGCTDCRSKCNGITGKYVAISESHFARRHRIILDGSEDECGYVFADHELEVVPQLGVGSKVIVTDCSYGCEFVDGKVVQPICGEMNKGIHEITATDQVLPASDQNAYSDSLRINDTIVKRISDGRVFFTKAEFLKEYVPPKPKFERGDPVTYNGQFYIISVVDNDKYTVTQTAMNYKYHRGIAGVNESELSEVAQ